MSFMGEAMPFVLRRPSPDCFGFKGESYVHAVMDGELFARENQAHGGIQARCA
jgi:hypothetical protein